MKLSINTIKEKYWVLADQVVVSAAAFLTNLLLARALGLAEYGKFSIVVMVQLLLLSVTMAFSSQIYQVVYASLTPQKRQNLTMGMLGQQLALFSVFIVCIPILYLISFTGKLVWLDSNKLLISMAVIATGFYLLQDFLRRVFISQTKGKLAFVIDLVTNFLQIITLLVFWYLHALTQVTAWFVIGFSFLPSILTGIILIRPVRLTAEALRFSWATQKEKAGWLVGSSLLQWGSGYFFVVAAGWFLGIAALGALRLAQYLFGLLNLLLQAIENYVMPKAAVFAGQMQAFWWQLLKKCLLLIVPFLLLFSFFARQILQLAGGLAYGHYAFVIYGLSLVYLLMAVGYPVRIAIRSLHLNKEYFTAYILSLVLNLCIAPWLLKNWMLYGVLTGLILNQLIVIGYWLIILKRKQQFLWKSFI
jgi:O-antigen/teichoic acid export membrane protein